LPVHEISHSQYPGVASNLDAHILGGGSPLVDRLTGRNAIRRNRSDAQRGLNRPQPGMSWEEFPFASTRQGGSGATLSQIPLSENVSHGRDSLWPFYRDTPVAAGDTFYVRSVP
jgi:hypothetical protein